MMEFSFYKLETCQKSPSKKPSPRWRHWNMSYNFHQLTILSHNMNWNEKYRIEYIHKIKVVNFLIEGKELIPDVDGRK